jgi:hypothetical protein
LVIHLLTEEDLVAITALRLNQPAHSRAKLIESAERELSAFFSAVAGSFGQEEATLAAKDWLQLLEAMKTLADSPGQLRLLSISAAAKLAKRVNSEGYKPSANSDRMRNLT